MRKLRLLAALNVFLIAALFPLILLAPGAFAYNFNDWTLTGSVNKQGNCVQFSYTRGYAAKTFNVDSNITSASLSLDVDNSITNKIGNNGKVLDTYWLELALIDGGTVVAQASFVGTEEHISQSESLIATYSGHVDSIQITVSGIDNGFWGGFYGPIMCNPNVEWVTVTSSSSSPSPTPSPSETSTATSSPSPTPSETLTVTPTPSPTASESSTSTASPSPESSTIVSPSPSNSPTAQSESPQPSQSPSPSETPSATTGPIFPPNSMHATGDEWGTISLTAPEGKIFVTVNFANYGLPIDYQANPECSADVTGYVSAAFINKNTGTIEVTNTAVNGDPCYGVSKHMSIILIYGDAPTPSSTPSSEPSPTPSPTLTPSETSTVTPTPTPTASPSSEPSPTPTPTPTPEPSVSVAPTPTPTPTQSQSPSNTEQTPSPTPTPTPSPTPTPQPTPEPSPAPSPTPTPTPTPSPTPTPTPTPSPTPTPTPTVSPTPEPTPTPTPTPSLTPEPTPSPSPTEAEPQPTPQPTPTEPEVTPSPEPTPTSPVPTNSPTPTPTETQNQETPSPKPSSTPSNNQGGQGNPPTTPPSSNNQSSGNGPSGDGTPASVVNNAKADGVISSEEKKAIVSALVSAAAGEAISAAEIKEAGIKYADLPPTTPVDVRTDENGNAVVITAEVAASLELVSDPGQLLGAVFTDPGAALAALGSVGADMSPAEREESTKMVLATVVAAGAAMNAVGAAAATRGNTNSVRRN